MRNSQQIPGQRSNILIICSDQHHPAMMGYRQYPFVETPNLDRLGHEGTHSSLFNVKEDPREERDLASDIEQADRLRAFEEELHSIVDPKATALRAKRDLGLIAPDGTDLTDNLIPWVGSGNPFGDDECGKFYARAMSVWSLLLACQGFVYEGPKARIGFAPVWNPDDHVSFFTAAEGWGLFGQRRDVEMQVMELSVEWGCLPIQIFEFEVPEGRQVQSIVASVGGEEVNKIASFSDSKVTLTLEDELVLTAGGKMAVEVSFSP